VQFWFPVSDLFFALNFILAIWLLYAIIRAGPAQRIQPELGRAQRPAAPL
jgi:hypothetical protein